MLKCLFVFGTRPEAIKLSPLILHMKSRPEEFLVQTVVTAQHRQMLDQVLTAFGVVPDFDLNLMTPGQSLFALTGRIISELETVLRQAAPDMVFVQGDTTSTFCGALAAFYARIPVGHVEAGLRTGDFSQPFPEEMNRVLTARLASLHFAATEGARQNLLREGVDPGSISVTGNTGIDAVLYVRDHLMRGEFDDSCWKFPSSGRKLVLVTAHRRESFGAGIESICAALRRIAIRPDVEIVWPVHRNPQVLEVVHERFALLSNVHLIDPVDYVPFVALMCRATLLLTDSGGIQEEGPSLGRPVIVMREKTERPEAVAAGTVRLAGTSEEQIVAAVNQLLDDPALCEAMSRIHNPYGDGEASRRICDQTIKYFQKTV